MIYYARYKNEKVVKDWKKSDCKKDYKYESKCVL